MANINHQRAALFAQNKRQDHYFFTSDDQGFYDEHNADAHAAKLQDKTVEKLDRADVDNWIKAEKPRQLAEAKKELAAASDELDNAQKAKEALGDKPKTADLMTANKLVNRAKLRVANAQVAVDELEHEGVTVEVPVKAVLTVADATAARDAAKDAAKGAGSAKDAAQTAYDALAKNTKKEVKAAALEELKKLTDAESEANAKLLAAEEDLEAAMAAEVTAQG